MLVKNKSRPKLQIGAICQFIRGSTIYEMIVHMHDFTRIVSIESFPILRNVSNICMMLLAGGPSIFSIMKNIHRGCSYHNISR